jgi:cupin 2 domain-containing protein
MNNIFKNIPEGLDEEFFESLLENDQFKIERIVSRGHSSEKDFWYDQEQNEWVLLVQGEAEIEFENETVQLNKGDHLQIDAHKKHRVKSTSVSPPAIWLAVHWK